MVFEFRGRVVVLILEGCVGSFDVVEGELIFGDVEGLRLGFIEEEGVV